MLVYQRVFQLFIGILPPFSCGNIPPSFHGDFLAIVQMEMHNLAAVNAAIAAIDISAGELIFHGEMMGKSVAI